MGVGKYINGVYRKAKGAAEYTSGKEVKGMQTFNEGADKTCIEMARFYEAAHLEVIPGSRDAMEYVDDVITHKAVDLGAFCGEKYRKVKDFLS